DQHGDGGNDTDAHAGVLHVGLEVPAAQRTRRAAAPAAPAEQAAELAVQVAPQLVEVGRLAGRPAIAPPGARPTRPPGAAGPRPGATVVAILTAAPAGVVEVENAPKARRQPGPAQGAVSLVHARILLFCRDAETGAIVPNSVGGPGQFRIGRRGHRPAL